MCGEKKSLNALADIQSLIPSSIVCFLKMDHSVNRDLKTMVDAKKRTP